MSKLPLADNSAWNEQTLTDYLQQAQIPLRLACHDREDYPLLCSLWFHFDGNHLWCVTHQNAYLLKRLRADDKCAFEVAENQPPYKGVRGQGHVNLDRSAARELLPEMIDRYLGSQDKPLAKWLLGRIDEEIAVRIDIDRITAWDYSKRMD